MPCRAQVKWKGDKWYPGIVTEYDEERRLHHVVYDDGDVRSYFMGDKTWKLIQIER